jgi:hypothetical protein
MLWVVRTKRDCFEMADAWYGGKEKYAFAAMQDMGLCKSKSKSKR